MSEEQTKTMWITVSIRHGSGWTSMEFTGDAEVELKLPTAMIPGFSPDPILAKLIEVAWASYQEKNKPEPDEPEG